MTKLVADVTSERRQEDLRIDCTVRR